MAQAEVWIENEQDKLEFTKQLDEVVRRVADTVLAQEAFAYGCEVSVLITDDKNIHLLNLEHRGKDAATDVLSFPMLEFDEAGKMLDTDADGAGGLLLGDIVISLERAAAQAGEYGHSLEREVGFLTAHSMLHLLGYDHETGEAAREVMRQKEERALQELGLTR